MSLSIKASISCNLGCTHCYENEARTAGNHSRYYDIDALEKTLLDELKRTKQTPTFHGGEPLLMAKDDMRRLASHGLEIAGGNTIQTNGLLIDDEWIDIFKKYRFTVGVSIDGPGKLNNMRKYGKNEESTLEATKKIIENIYRLRQAGITVGLITVLHRLNAVKEVRQELKDFYLEMASIGVTSVRNNEMILDDPELQHFNLTNDELAEFYCDMADFSLDRGFMFNPYRDIVDLLLGMNYGTCVFGAGHQGCDVLNTKGEEVVFGDGSKTGCLKTAKIGINYLRAPGHSQERYDILQRIPVSEGGCGGCKFWAICGGLCPSEGENGDWRAKTRYCKAWYALYSHIESKLRNLLPNLRMITDYTVEGDNALESIFNTKNGHNIAFSPMIRVRQEDGKVITASTWRHDGTWMAPNVSGLTFRKGK